MPHCFLNSLRHDDNEADIFSKSFRVHHPNKNEILTLQEELQDCDINNHSPTDWSNINSLPIVTRWMLQKIPEAELTKGNVEPKYESRPLSEVSDDETTVPDPMGGEFSQLLSVLSRADMICGGGSGPYFLKTVETPRLSKIAELATAKPFYCPTCNQGFSNRSNLRAHQRAKGHHHWGWKCDLCRKPFSSYQYLLRHLQTPCIKGLVANCGIEMK